MKKRLILSLLAFTIFSACESEAAKKERLMREEIDRIELEQESTQESEAERLRVDQSLTQVEKRANAERLEGKLQLEKERTDQRYIDNTLRTGSTPYLSYYGGNPSCDEEGCSQLKVTTSNSDVLVTIKRNEKVVRHAFIQEGDSFTFSLPNGTYQAFFYYGRGWNPEKKMKSGKIKGGFLANEDFGKDEPRSLYNNILEYELILQENGNFSTRPSNPEEAL